MTAAQGGGVYLNNAVGNNIRNSLFTGNTAPPQQVRQQMQKSNQLVQGWD